MNKGKVVGGGLIIIIIASVAYAYISLEQDQVVESETAKIAAFNIQIFGKTKSEKEEVMNILTKIVREFDIVLIQEIRDASEQTIPNFIEEINQLEGPEYSFIRSERLGRTTSKEAYAYVYNTETVQFIQGADYVYNDVNDVFERDPYIGGRARCIKGGIKKNMQTSKPIKIPNSFSIKPNLQLMGNNLFIIASRLLHKIL